MRTRDKMRILKKMGQNGKLRLEGVGIAEGPNDIALQIYVDGEVVDVVIDVTDLMVGLVADMNGF